MAIKIKPKFSAADIAKWSEQTRLMVINAIHSRLQFVGETFVTNARDELPKWIYIESNLGKYHRNGKAYIREAGGGESFSDWTGNLRSSIGYVVYYNGQILSSAFPGEAAEGVTEGRKVADEIAADYPQGFVLVCVAGMEYAASVESKSYDVITNSSTTAVTELRQAMRELKDKIKRL